jgi:hypothetical protein
VRGMGRMLRLLGWRSDGLGRIGWVVFCFGLGVWSLSWRAELGYTLG